MARRAAKVDDNQDEVVSAFRSLGYSVAITSMCGDGFSDLVVGKHERNYLIEVKDGNKPPSRRKLTKEQEKFKAKWRGQYDVVTSVEDVLKWHEEGAGQE